MSPEDIRAMSVVTVETPDTYEDDGFPIDKGLMDPRLGVIDPSLVCRTCGFRGGDC
jgi:DNA-directed RNA polymerase subunit A'